MNSSLAMRLALVAAAFAAPNLSGELVLNFVEMGPKTVRTAVPEIAARGRALVRAELILSTVTMRINVSP